MVAGGGMVNISFQTAYSWTITKDVDWLSTSLTEGGAGTTSFFIIADENKSEDERRGTIYINLSNNRTYEIVVTQEPSDGIQHLAKITKFSTPPSIITLWRKSSVLVLAKHLLLCVLSTSIWKPMVKSLSTMM